MKEPRLRLAFSMATLIACVTFAFGQGTTGSLSGTVSDPSGVVPNATVTVTGSAGVELTTQTSDNGTFSVPALGAGVYTVTVTAPNYKKAVITGVKIDVGKPSTINVELEIGPQEQTITIIGAGGELLNTQNATVGSTIVGRQIVEQPQASRDALDLVTLLPGVQTTGRPRTSTVNGLPKGALNITIDGTDVQDSLISSQDGFFTFIRPRIDAIDEVTVSTATPGAESSGDGAVQIKFVTRGGTNDFHGSLYWYHREPTLSANYFFNNQNLAPDPGTGKAPINRILLNQQGGRVGGPIRIPKLFDGRDKAFFFVNYEDFRLPEQQLRQRVILSQPAQTGIFRYLTPSGVQSVNLLSLAAANGLPSTIDPTIGALLGQIRTSTGQGGIQPRVADPNREDFSFVGIGGQQRDFTAVRLDFNLTDNHHLENIWNYQEFGGKPVDFLNSTDPSFPGFPNSAGQDSQRWSNTTALRSILTPNITNEARFGMLGGISNFGGTITPGQFENQGGFDLNLFDLGITDASAVAFAPQRFLRLFGLGPSRRNTPSFNFSDTLTWVKRTHSFNFGGSYNLIKPWSQDIDYIVPRINFGLAEGDPAESVFNDPANFPGASATDIATAAQLYATLVGRVTAVDRNANLTSGKFETPGLLVARFRQRQYALFAQDTWRLRPNLTLNFGLRWEPQEAATSDTGDYAKVSYAGLFGVSGEGNLFKPGTLTGQPTQFTPLGIGERLFDTDYKNFAPSVGFAWSPNWQKGLLGRFFGSGGQSVIRAGYSVAFVREGLANVVSTIQSNPGGFLTINKDTADGTLPIGTLFRDRSALGPPSFPSTPTFPLEGELFDAAFGFDPKLKTGLVHSWTVGLQREIFKDTVVEARYVGTRGRDLWRRYNLNEVNMVENGFLNEFRLAQANLAANQAAGRGNNFRYFGPGTGTSPLPSMLGFFTGLPASAANDPASYLAPGGANFASAARVRNLSPNFAQPLAFANAIVGRPDLFAGNAAAAGLPENFFVVNPGKLGGASLTTNDVNTWYDALQFELRRRFSGGLLLQANYTWSKSLSNFFASSQTVFSQPLTLRSDNEVLEKFRAPQDLEHTFKVNWIYELPFGRGKMFLTNANGIADRVLGGWEFHGTGRVQSGRPFSMGNVQLVGMTLAELQESVDARRQPNRTVTYLPDDIILNTRRAFSVVTAGPATAANPFAPLGYSALGVPTGRYLAPNNSNGCLQAFSGQCGFANLILEGPRFVRFDLSAVKKIRFTENTNLELRVEFLNALNNINFLVGGSSAVDQAFVTANGTTALLNPDFSIATFGRVTAAYQDISTTNDPGGRPVQFVLRFNF